MLCTWDIKRTKCNPCPQEHVDEGPIIKQLYYNITLAEKWTGGKRERKPSHRKQLFLKKLYLFERENKNTH